MSNTERVAKLSERLKNLQVNANISKSSKINEFELRLQDIEKQFLATHEDNTKKFQTLKNDVIGYINYS